MNAIEQAAEALRIAKNWIDPGLVPDDALAAIDNALARLPAERASVPPDRERLANQIVQMREWLKNRLADNGDLCGFEILASTIADACDDMLRSPADGWRPTHQHYKGGLYRVIGPGRIEADLSSVVIYENRKGQRWVRPTEDFIGTVEINGATMQRFTPLPIPPAGEKTP